MNCRVLLFGVSPTAMAAVELTVQTAEHAIMSTREDNIALSKCLNAMSSEGQLNIPEGSKGWCVCMCAHSNLPVSPWIPNMTVL